MARWEHSIDINATPARVWAIMANVARWPDWTESIISVDEVTPDFGAGGSAMVHAKGQARSRFTVTKWEPDRGFDWETKSRGARAIGGHWIEDTGGGRSRVTLSIDIPGPVAVLARPFIAGGIKRNLKLESEGLKRRSEAAA